MSIVTLGQFYGGPGSPTKVDFWLDGSGDKVAAKKVASEAKQITHIVVRVDAITGTPPTYAARLETISSFVPSGTLVAAGASGTFTPAAANTVHEVALSTPWTPSINDEFAVVIEYSSGTINSSNRAEITYRATMFHSLGNGEAPFTNSGSGYSQVDGTLALLGVKYSDGTYMRCSGCLEGSSPTGTSDFDDGTNPDERGVVWTQPYTVDCVGAALETRIFSGGTGDIRLYEDSTQLASVSFDQDRLEGNAATDLVVGYWAAQTLTKDRTYRIALKATHAKNNVRQLSF